jgi:soluble lytic murein transglycosylase-like protein
MRAGNRFFRIGIILRGNKFWLSELVSIVFVSILLGALLTITAIILYNEISAHHSAKIIESLKTENIVLENNLDRLKKTSQIARTLCSFVGSRIPQNTLYKLSEFVYTNSTQFGYDPVLLLAVIHIESYFNTKAMGKFRSGTLSGAMGLMQLKLTTAQHVAQQLQLGPLTKEDLLKPEINIVLGVAYLTQLVKQFKSFKLGLLAYNQGPATIISNLSNKQQLSAQYYRKVLRSYYNLKEIEKQSVDFPASAPLCQ